MQSLHHSKLEGLPYSPIQLLGKALKEQPYKGRITHDERNICYVRQRIQSSVYIIGDFQAVVLSRIIS